MKILVTNDDGIYSSGIFALWEIAKEFGEVNVIAPVNEKSAVGHGITISNLLKKLKVTKQSLNRILNDLVKFNIISFVKDERDSRMKHVHLTKKGEEVFKEIFTSQKKRIYNALIKSSSFLFATCSC